MNHVLIGLALCAALLIYPGGLTLAASAWALAVGARGSVRGSLSGLGSGLDPVFVVSAILLGTLTMASLPWSGSPLAALSIAGLTSVGLGGVALTVLGLLALDSLINLQVPGGGRWLAASVSSAVAVLLLAEVLGTAQWAAILAAPGPGALLGRLAVGLLCLVVAPWASGPHPYLTSLSGLAWAVRFGVAVLICFPALRLLPFELDLVVILAGSLALGTAWALALKHTPLRGLDPAGTGTAAKL